MRVLKKYQFAFCAAAACCAAVLVGCAFSYGDGSAQQLAGAEYVFSYAENQAEGYPTTRAARYFSDLVRERSDGRILIRVESGGALGDEASVARQVAYGGIDFARLSAASVAEDVPALRVLTLPYLFQDEAHMWRVLDGTAGETLMETLQGSGLHGLSWYGAGARSFYTRARAVRCPEDMRGMRIRVQESEMMQKLVSALGAVPVSAQFSEVRGMLEVGEIDGAENNPSSYVSEKHYLQAGYFTLDEHSRIPELQLISQTTWEQLSAGDQELILDCAQASAQYERQLWSEYERYALDTMEEAGCRVQTLSDEEREAFRALASPLYESYRADETSLALLELIEAAEQTEGS